jgi:hypothetical protein
VLKPCNAFPVTRLLVISQGWRAVNRSVKPPLPRGGMDAIKTPTGASLDSRYFCTMPRLASDR